MPVPDLHFNILTFDWPKEKLTFYFSKEDNGRCQRIHKSIFPAVVESIFPGISANGSGFIYTTFGGETEGFIPCTIDARSETPAFIKRYFDRKINYYFRVIVNQIVQVGFIKENTIWLPIPAADTDQFEVYEKFAIKVQICTVSQYPSLFPMKAHRRF